MSLNLSKDSESMNFDSAFTEKISERILAEKRSLLVYESVMNLFKENQESRKLRQMYDEKVGYIKLLQEAPVEAQPLTEIKSPPTTFLKGLEEILEGELLNQLGWELIIELAEQNHDEKLAIQFQQYLNQLETNIQTLKQWVLNLTLNHETTSEEKTFFMEGNPEMIH